MDLAEEPREEVQRDREHKVERFLSGDLVVQDLNFRYPTRPDVHVLKDVSFEVHPGFYVAVVVAQLAGGAEQGTIDALAVTFVVSRVLFGIAYIADKGSLRSLIWAVGMACIVALFVTAA